VSGYVAGADPSVLADPTATQEVARRRFAVPTVVTSIDGDDVELDPADEDQRELLLVAEHPKYQHVLDDPFSDDLVDGEPAAAHRFAPRHRQPAVGGHPAGGVAGRSAASRRRAYRHAILHALAYELGEELYPALTGQHAPDPDMSAYRDRLRQL